MDAKTPATPGNVHEKAPVTSWDIAGASIGVAGIEPTTSCSQGKRYSLESPEILGYSEQTPVKLHPTLHSIPGSPPVSPPDFAMLLAQLAPLPAEQRAAFAALLAPPTVVIPSPAPERSALDDTCPLDH